MKLPFDQRLRGFSLVELLVVMAIMAVLTMLLAPAGSNLASSMKLTQAGDQMVQTLALARQNALTKSTCSEVRFYQFEDREVPGGGGTDGHYLAIQVFTIDNTGTAVPLGKVQGLPSSIIMDHGAQLSPLLDQAFTKTVNPAVAIPRAGTSYQCRSFRFRADGSTDLPLTGGPWFITLHKVTDGDGLSASDVGVGKPIKNYITVQIDPVSGSVTTYRP